MDTRDLVKSFLERHNFYSFTSEKLLEDVLTDMKKGFEGGNSEQAMIRAGSARTEKISDNETAIVIDAGGTNFRSCLVTKTTDGIQISHFNKTSMPAMNKELSRDEFFDEIADNISRLKNLSDKISFCFSYAMEITRDGDGKILNLSKQIKAPQVIGTFLGKELLQHLRNKGWKNVKTIKVLNDTKALLLSSFLDQDKEAYDLNLAFILGTGMNSALVKNQESVVTECGMFSKITMSDFDFAVDQSSSNPGKSIIEKMCSGAYLGSIAHECLYLACKEGLFSDAFSSSFMKISKLLTAYFDPIIDEKRRIDSENDDNPLYNLFIKSDSSDKEVLVYLIESIIDRSAKLTAIMICSGIIFSDKKNGELPVRLACNGSTFWKTPLLKNKVMLYLKNLLKQNEINIKEIEIIQIEDDIIKGTFQAAFIE